MSSALLLEKMLEKKRIPNALLFVGSSSAQLETIGYDFVCRYILEHNPEQKIKLKAKTHPDIHFYHPEGKVGMHSIDTLRALCKEAAFYPVESKMKFFIVSSAERMLPSSSNALLKTLEEPISHSSFILLTTAKDLMLPTLVSRCQTFFFGEKTSSSSARRSHLCTLLKQNPTFKEIEVFALEIDNEKKANEKQLIKELSKELTLQQRKRVEDEIEGSLALKYQTECFELLETFYLLSFDQFLRSLGIAEKQLKLGDVELSKKLPPVQQMEKMLREARMAVERSTPFASVLLALCLQLKVI